MNVLSLFDGMSCGQIALNKLGIKYDNYFACEIKPHAIRVTQHNFPETVQLGNVEFVTKERFGSFNIDLLIGGSPCQDFSRANKERNGVDGEKSGLFWEYVRILKEIKPKYFLLENVKMKKDQEDIITEALGVKPVNVNSKLLSGQLRDRYYWTNIDFDSPSDLEVNLNSLLDGGYSEREKSRCLLESDSRPLSTPVKMFHRHQKFKTLIFKDEKHSRDCKEHYEDNFKGKSAKDIDLFEGDLSVYDGVRYLNRRESERLQTVPEGYTDVISDMESLCLLGDGWTVDVITHILKNMEL